MGERSGDRDFDQEIGISIDRGFSGISTCWEIAWDINRMIVLVKGLVSIASPLGYDRGILAIQIDKTVESSSHL